MFSDIINSHTQISILLKIYILKRACTFFTLKIIIILYFLLITFIIVFNLLFSCFSVTKCNLNDSVNSWRRITKEFSLLNKIYDSNRYFDVFLKLKGFVIHSHFITSSFYTYNSLLCVYNLFFPFFSLLLITCINERTKPLLTILFITSRKSIERMQVAE